MKIFLWFLLTSSIPIFSAAATVGKIHSDKNGMPRCIEGNPSILIYWDEHAKVVPKTVFVITLDKYAQENSHFLKSCDQWSYALAWPQGLTSVSMAHLTMPEGILPALEQIAQGAIVYRSERTAQEFYKNHPYYFQLGKAESFTQLRKKYGQSFTSDLVQVWIADLVKAKKMDPERCSDLVGTCEYYLCQEANHKCGAEEGYLVGFGYKYCSLSLDGLYQKMESSLGKNWTLNTARCLQEKMDQELKISTSAGRRCEKISRDAYASHPNCYVQNGFCEMPLRDRIHIFEVVKSQIFTARSFIQLIQTLSECEGHND